MAETFKIVRQFKPDLVIGTGGYVCGPMVLAAHLQGVPTAIQEQNAFPGLTNRILGRFVNHIFLAYSEAAKYFPAQKISAPGNPIRTDEFVKVSRTAAEKELGIQPGCINLLVFGGSQSARRINQSLLPILKNLLENFSKLQIILMTGTKEYDNISEVVKSLNLSIEQSARLKLVAYFYKISNVYKTSDIVLARAGAISLAEITCFGIPAILVPYPYATNNHQEFNARVLESHGAAEVILEADLTPEQLLKKLSHVLLDEKLRQKMSKASIDLSRPKAVGGIVDELLQMIS